jgi:hypothetical protein
MIGLLSYFHSLMTYGIIFLGNSSDSIQVFRIQKRVITIITGSKCRDPCRELFNKLKILPLQSQYIYIYSLSLLVVNNKDQYKETYEIHSINSRQKSNLYLLLSNLTTYQKGTYYFGIKVFNNLPTDIKKLSHKVKHFSLALKRFLYSKSFYINDEY